MSRVNRLKGRLLQILLTPLRPLLSQLPLLRNRHYLLFDAIVLCLTPLIALLLRVETLANAERYEQALLTYTIVGLVVRVPMLYAFGLYRRFWRFATVDELAYSTLAVTTATVVMSAVFVWCRGFGALDAPPLPRSVPLIEAMLVLGLIGSTRFSARIAHRLLRQPDQDAKLALVVGAGNTGQMIVRELQMNPAAGMYAVGYVDDDPAKRGVKILNVPVLGTCEDLPQLLREHKIEQVIIAMPTATGLAIRETTARCQAAGVPTKIVPGMSEILDGSISVEQLRNVQIEDLLRREPVQTDIQAVRDLIRGKRVLVTGGGGSIGSELCRQVLRCAPSELVIVGHGENSVFEIQNELLRYVQQTFPDDRGHTPAPMIHATIADIRFPARIRMTISRFRPDIIFHAAAHKHVPLMEAHPAEAVSNNVLGTKHLLDAALEFGVENFVMISTDKAVNPTSVMGATKRAAELFVLDAARRSGKPYVAVRFGNVLGSRGSVIHTFKRQIAAGGPVTVSHPEMRRFFMTIPEAVQLVLQASVLGTGGEIFLLDMGEPVKISDLAQDLIRLSGLEVGRDIEVVYSGIRPGEKLYEELFVPGETYRPTCHEKILIATNSSSFVPKALPATLDSLRAAVSANDDVAVIECLQDLIPEYREYRAEARLTSPADGDLLKPQLPDLAFASGKVGSAQ
ncbi:MAG: polysaccharide biosynthesis protein [Armatimonadota bacterium]